ncbi:hypothetical protein GCM10023195_05830 [Actinoallomurus liliacearum]|uniref:HTH cro/C1-type domain-containing protein n=1 Tax=Actinoallomurus liliacearum TaxID=1080073 RepID=A0ABP8TD98_9ACTN
MDNREEVKTFLSTRRAKITPGDAGLPVSGRRRVPGLRRNEVADLAGVSVEYYAQLERGNLAGVSESVLDALSRALRLDDAERAHLADLARAAGPAPRTRRSRQPTQQQVRSADPGLSLIAFTAQAGSPDDHALKLLASWAVTHTPADALTPDWG